MYAAQEIPQIDAEIAQKGHFLVETIFCRCIQHMPWQAFCKLDAQV